MKSIVTPYIWETHESGSLSVDWDIVGEIVVGSNASINRHSNSNYYGHDDYDMYSAYRTNSGFTSRNWYISFWFRLGNNWEYHNGGYPAGLPDNYMSNIKTTLLWNPGVECALSTCGYPAQTGTWHCGPQGAYGQYNTEESQESYLAK